MRGKQVIRGITACLILLHFSIFLSATVQTAVPQSQVIFTSSSRLLHSRGGSSSQAVSNQGYGKLSTPFGNKAMAVCSHAVPSMTSMSSTSTVLKNSLEQPVIASTYTPPSLQRTGEDDHPADPYLDPVGDIPLLLIAVLIGAYTAYQKTKKRLSNKTC